jgi:hypothetical protein
MDTELTPDETRQRLEDENARLELKITSLLERKRRLELLHAEQQTLVKRLEELLADRNRLRHEENSLLSAAA